MTHEEKLVDWPIVWPMWGSEELGRSRKTEWAMAIA